MGLNLTIIRARVQNGCHTKYQSDYKESGRSCRQTLCRGYGIARDLVVAHLFHKRSPEEIAADYEIPLAQVYAAFAYYYQHKDELDEDIRSQILRLLPDFAGKRNNEL